jgi:DNA-binding LytR/AlgR family response regulator
MLIKCVVIDDDQNDLKLIERAFLFISFGTDMEFRNIYLKNPHELCLDEVFHIYILDIDMPGINGFELAEKIYERNKKAAVVFCTAHEDLVFHSFHLNAFYFVRKSNLKEDLVDALQKYKASHPFEHHTYTINTAGDSTVLRFEDIVYIEVRKNDAYFHMNSGKVFCERKTMNMIRAEINDQMFLSVSKSVSVNASYISKIDDQYLIVSECRIDIPKTNAADVKKQYARYIMMR